MCLCYTDSPKEDEMSGIGYKVVRKNDDGTYSPFYPYAAKNGDGCCFNPYEIKNYYKNRMVYRIDEQYVVKHRRFALTTTHDERYPAGVHLYIDYKKAFWRLAEADQMGGNFAVIKCKYEKALAIDRQNGVVVVKKITPIEEIMDSKMEM